MYRCKSVHDSHAAIQQKQQTVFPNICDKEERRRLANLDSLPSRSEDNCTASDMAEWIPRGLSAKTYLKYA